MSNVFNPAAFVIDSTITSAVAADDSGATLKLPKGTRVTWQGATTAAHAVLITDAAGVPVFSAVASGANFMYSEIINRDVNSGFLVPTLGSGKLYIYIPSGRLPV
jgi:hypothetical protein